MRYFSQARSFLTLSNRKALKLENPTLDQWCFRRSLSNGEVWKKNKQKPQLQKKLWDQKGELLYSLMAAKANRKKKRLLSVKSFSQLKTMDPLFTIVLPISFFPSKKCSSTTAVKNLILACLGCRPWFEVLFWSQINLYSLEKYSASYLFQINKLLLN